MGWGSESQGKVETVRLDENKGGIGSSEKWKIVRAARDCWWTTCASYDSNGRLESQ
jgi:hypothetical protein